MASNEHTGPVGYTGFVHPAASIRTRRFTIGGVATSARNVVLRCDQAVVLAQQIQGATSATDAAKLMSQLVSVTDQLVAGFDANGDGKITWEAGEGGLQQAQEHVTLMLATEMKAGR